MIDILLKNKWLSLKRSKMFKVRLFESVLKYFFVLHVMFFVIVLGLEWEKFMTLFEIRNFDFSVMLFLLLIWFMRMVSPYRGDYSFLQYVHFPIRRDLLVKSHIVINCINPFWLLSVLWIALVGYKGVFLQTGGMNFSVWFVRMCIFLILLELGVILVKQILVCRRTVSFLASIGILSSVWTLMAMASIVRINQSIVTGIMILLFITSTIIVYHFVYQMMLLDFSRMASSSSKFTVYRRRPDLINQYFSIQFHAFERCEGLKNDFYFAFSLTVLVIFLNKLLLPEAGSTHLIFWISFFSAGHFYPSRYLLVLSSQDRQSAGFYRTQPIPIIALIRSRILAVHMFYLLIVSINVIGFVIFRSMIQILSISIAMFFMGILSYWIYFIQDNHFDVDAPDQGIMATNLQFHRVIPIALLYVLLVFIVSLLFGDDFHEYRLQNFWKTSIPGMIGLTSLTFHKSWMKRIEKRL